MTVYSFARSCESLFFLLLLNDELLHLCFDDLAFSYEDILPSLFNIFRFIVHSTFSPLLHQLSFIFLPLRHMFSTSPSCSSSLLSSLFFLPPLLLLLSSSPEQAASSHICLHLHVRPCLILLPSTLSTCNFVT